MNLSCVKSGIGGFFRVMDGKINGWAIAYAHIILPICVLILVCLVVSLILTVVYTIVGVSAVESGVYYNHLKDVI